MFSKIKNFIKNHVAGFVFGVICVVVLFVFFSCSSIGDNNRVQFGLTNEAVSEGAVQVKDEGYITL